MELLIILAACVLLLILYLLAREFQRAAELKGYQSQKYFWIAFLCGFVGYLLVIALPDRSGGAELPSGTADGDSALPEL